MSVCLSVHPSVRPSVCLCVCILENHEQLLNKWIDLEKISGLSRLVVANLGVGSTSTQPPLVGFGLHPILFPGVYLLSGCWCYQVVSYLYLCTSTYLPTYINYPTYLCLPTNIYQPTNRYQPTIIYLPTSTNP